MVGFKSSAGLFILGLAASSCVAVVITDKNDPPVVGETGAGGGGHDAVSTSGGMSSCADGLKNGGETGVDCGGSCGPCEGGSSSSTGSSGGSCVPTDPVCTKVQSDCVALEDNKNQDKFALRMAHLSLKKPAGLVTPAIKSIVENAVVMNLATCNINGQGTFNLLMQFDTVAKKLTVGGAKPVANPTNGYSFLTETVQGLAIKPASVDVTIGADGAFAPNNGGGFIVLPIYLAVADAEVGILLPVQQATIAGKLTSDSNCVGKFDPSLLKPKICVGQPFVDAGDLDGHIILEEADTVVISALNQSLCVLLSGDPIKYGDGGMPVGCKKTGGKIDFKGDWCTATNLPADATCADAVKLQGSLAASAVKLSP